jgi:hypothetical protein
MRPSGTEAGHDAVGAVLKHLHTNVGEKTNPLPRKIFDHICRMVLEEGFATEEENDDYIGHVAVAAARLGDQSFFREAHEHTLVSWGDSRWSELGGLIDIEAPSVDLKE